MYLLELLVQAGHEEGDVDIVVRGAKPHGQGREHVRDGLVVRAEGLQERCAGNCHVAVVARVEGAEHRPVSLRSDLEDSCGYVLG